MEDRELKKLLLETCPIHPGQEASAWSALREHLYAKSMRSGWSWIFYPGWRTAIAFVALIVFVPAVADLLYSEKARALATAESQAPGIYATSFYSQSAKAQVVWLNGMEPASDKLTYLDTTGVVADPNESAPTSAGDPNSL